jgi:hypothetical protein
VAIDFHTFSGNARAISTEKKLAVMNELLFGIPCTFFFVSASGSTYAGTKIHPKGMKATLPGSNLTILELPLTT